MKKAVFLSVFCLACTPLFAVYGETSLLAGVGNFYGDGTHYSQAVYNTPGDIEVGADGTIYIADTLNHIIRKIDTATGIISTLAGSGSAGYAEGAGSAASFNTPSNICLNQAQGVLYVSDTGNYRVRSIDISTGQTSLIAGTGAAGLVDGSFGVARFAVPKALAYDTASNCIYVAESTLNRIRKIDFDLNTVTTVAGNAISGYLEGTGTTMRFNVIGGLVMDSASGMLYVSDFGNNRVRVIDTSTYTSSLVAGSGTLGYTEGEGAAASFRRPLGLKLSASGRIIFAADSVNHMIRIIDLDANSLTSRVAGSGTQGDTEGASFTARFSTPNAAAIDFSANVMYVADTANSKIKKVDFNNSNAVSFYSGMGSYGGDGNTIPAATFNTPVDVCVNTLNGRVYILDSQNHVLRMIDESGIVSTIAGAGTAGYSDGFGTAALFNGARGICIDPYAEKLYISDTGNNRIRAVDLLTYEVTTLAGDGTQGYAEGIGTAARFFNPEGLDIDTSSKMLFIADTRNQRIRRINLNTMQSYLIAGSGTAGYAEGTGPAAFFNWPEGVAHDQYDGLFVADTNNNVIRRINLATGTTIHIAGYGAAGFENGFPIDTSFNRPRRLAYDPVVFRLYVTDGLNYAVRGVPLYTGAETDTTAGNGTSGYAEGIGTAARFGSVKGMAMDKEKQVLYLADGANNRIRKVDVFFPTPTASVTPTITETRTPTETPTVEGTVTDTPTQTMTHTATPTFTDTPYFSPTHTATETQSATLTVTYSETATATDTATVTQTPTITETHTATETPEDTATSTATFTATQSATFSHTASLTPTTDLTAEATFTETPGLTASPSFTATATLTQTAGASGTQTPSQTASVTQTVTETPAGSATASVTASAEPSFSATQTVTVTESVTYPATPVFTATLSPTPTQTPVDYYGEIFIIEDDFVHPNPNFGTFTIVFEPGISYAEGEIKIFTSGFRLVHARKLGPGSAGVNKETFGLTGRLANGVYFYTIVLKDGSGRAARQAGEIVVIR